MQVRKLLYADLDECKKRLHSEESKRTKVGLAFVPCCESGCPGCVYPVPRVCLLRASLVQRRSSFGCVRPVFVSLLRTPNKSLLRALRVICPQEIQDAHRVKLEERAAAVEAGLKAQFEVLPPRFLLANARADLFCLWLAWRLSVHAATLPH
jgi:hypothetical protein